MQDLEGKLLEDANKKYFEENKPSILSRIRSSSVKYFGAGAILAGLCIGFLGCNSQSKEDDGDSKEIRDVQQEAYNDVKNNLFSITTFCYHDSDNDNFPAKNLCFGEDRKGISVEMHSDNDYSPKCPDGCIPPRVIENKLTLDCADNDNKVYPFAKEICDDKDNNCNGKTDENQTRPCYTECGKGLEYCIDGKWKNCDAKKPEKEKCDNENNDCDDKIDEDLTKKCYNACKEEGIEKCIEGKWKDCNAPKVPKEKCNDIDEDCNGKTDEGLKIECYSACDEGFIICSNGQWSECSAITDCCTSGEEEYILKCPPNNYSFMFVIDNSGSMSENDPDDLRYEGLYIFVENMKSGDKGGVVPFDDSVSFLGMTSDKEELEKMIETAKNTNVGGGTEIGAALYIGIENLSKETTVRVLLLLTDGNSSYNPIEMKELAEKKEIVIFALGLGNGVNSEILMQTVTKEGEYYFIDEAKEIAIIFSEVFKKTQYNYWKVCNEKGQWVDKYGVCE